MKACSQYMEQAFYKQELIAPRSGKVFGGKSKEEKRENKNK